jgi:alpha-mannosidase
MVNFKASQGGEVPLRYRLTTHTGPVDDVAASRFGLESTTPPVPMRDYVRTGPETGQFLDVPADAPVIITAKPADDGDGVIVRIQNLTGQEQVIQIRFVSAEPTSANLTSPLEINADALAIDESRIIVPVAGLSIQSLRVRF